MSVAFRRESDEEHLEPRFEVPLPPGPNLVTPAGLARITGRIAALEADLPQLTNEVGLAAAKRDLRYWQARLATAEVQPAASGETVAFGCRVQFHRGGKLREIVIVGADEADPAQGWLAFTAPLARALMGAATGEQVAFAGQDEAIEIMNITPL